MREIGIGVVGWGFMGRAHTHGLREMGLFYEKAGFRPVLKCVCSRRAETLEQAVRDGGFERSTTDFDEMLRMKDIEAVSICTPNSQHKDMAIKALRAGKHVYIDKPIALDAEEVREIRQAVLESGRKLQVVQQNRYHPSIMRAKQLVEEGRIGDVLTFRCNYLHASTLDPNRPAIWRQIEKGGVLVDLATHATDLVLHLAGPIDQVMCETRVLRTQRPGKNGVMVNTPSEDQAVMLVRLKNGALGTMEVSKIATGTEDELSIEINGSNGAIRWNVMQTHFLEFFDNTLPQAPLGGERGFVRIACGQRLPEPGGHFLPASHIIGWDRAHMHCYYSFLDAIVNDKPVHPDIDEALELMKVIDAMYQSHEEKRWIKV